MLFPFLWKIVGKISSTYEILLLFYELYASEAFINYKHVYLVKIWPVTN